MDELLLEGNQMEKPFHLGRGGGQRETSFSITYPASLLTWLSLEGPTMCWIPKASKCRRSSDISWTKVLKS